MKKVLFFSRDYQSYLFPMLNSDRYESFHVTLTKQEKRNIIQKGHAVQACFEEDYDQLQPSQVPDVYLESSFNADRYLGILSLHERITLLGKEITFWTNILDQVRPDLIINETVAIEISEVLYLESKKRGIVYKSWMSFPAGRKFYWQHTPIHNSLQGAMFNPPGPASLKEAEEYITKVQNGLGTPFYAINLQSRYNVIKLLKHIKGWLNSKKQLTKYNRSKSAAIFGDSAIVYRSSIIAYFNSMLFKYDQLENYQNYELIFYPLHYEPEAALKYMSEFFDNQYATIENITKCLKTNQVLVVKEHPQQPGILLSKKFRELRKNNSNIISLPAEYPTKHLIAKSTAVITLNSTAGFEALILGKPTYLFGRVFFDRCPGVVNVLTFDELRAHLRQPLPPQTDTHQIKQFVAEMITYCQNGNPFPHAEVYSKENVSLIRNAIERSLYNDVQL